MHIRCAQCDKPVEKWEYFYDVCRMVHRIKVWCHGEKDQCEVPDFFVTEAGRELAEGVAFTTKRLTSN